MVYPIFELLLKDDEYVHEIPSVEVAALPPSPTITNWVPYTTRTQASEVPQVVERRAEIYVHEVPSSSEIATLPASPTTQSLPDGLLVIDLAETVLNAVDAKAEIYVHEVPFVDLATLPLSPTAMK